MQLYIALLITAILYIHVHCRKPKLPIDMEYALKAEDIGNGAVSENTPQNDDGSDCVHIDCDRKNDGEDNNDGDTKRGDGCDEYKYHECVDGDRKSDGEDNNDGDTKRGDGCDEYNECVDGDRKSDGEDKNDGDIKIGDGCDEYDVSGCDEYDVSDGNSSHNSGKGSTHSRISHHGNSHQNVNEIVLYANEIHKIKGAITQKVEMNIKKAQEKDKYYYDKKHCNLKVYMYCILHCYIMQYPLNL